MNLNKIKLSQLRALVTIAECGNFSEAALKLDVTQSTISHAIATLEDELGVTLLKRGRHGARLTSVGDRITTHARDVLGLLDTIGSEANQARGVQGGNLRIASFRSVATHVLPGAIARLHRRYPTIAISVHEMDEVHQLKQALAKGEVDLCVAETIDGDDVETLHIFNDDYVALLPPGYRPKTDALTVDDMRQMPIIGSSHSSCGLRIRTVLGAQEHPLEIAYCIRHDSSMVAMVQQGLGIAILPRLAAEPVPPDVQIVSMPFPISRPIGATILKDALHTPALYAFLDALREVGEFSRIKAV
ncbi:MULTISPECIES: LysR family transcriptional regulator [Cyanophyceae]|uniref:LysR family transcriptional regulator n=1 Tax=Cyanophyceae TaxID=3028117 RepID=UPI001686DF64|nr:MULTISPECIES: LysR family transcriptional regulator [Cyanophyceae]MBD1915493.1 LysR family transcriptional regulator [Phormidium sp. FACHB-77]MBD2031803.1 LysR family transcriptional regulator [Phormidium sp. FACHB-322]MBD2050553.1 LysR family transcriptional regulator [Leptolyngbya sp. FACHB-60]